MLAVLGRRAPRLVTVPPLELVGRRGHRRARAFERGEGVKLRIARAAPRPRRLPPHHGDRRAVAVAGAAKREEAREPRRVCIEAVVARPADDGLGRAAGGGARALQTAPVGDGGGAGAPFRAVAPALLRRRRRRRWWRLLLLVVGRRRRRRVGRHLVTRGRARRLQLARRPRSLEGDRSGVDGGGGRRGGGGRGRGGGGRGRHTGGVAVSGVAEAHLGEL